MVNAFTIDVEDYYSVVAHDRLDIDRPPTDAVVRNTHGLMSLLADGKVRATFFVLGNVAEAFPQLIRDIAAGGHEIGVHGYYHRQIFKLTPEQFRREVGDAKKLLEDLAGRAVEGHRAPAFSIRADTQWALEVLAEVGFRYDSSVFPISGRRYGWLNFPPDIHRMDLGAGRGIIEAPMSAVHIFGKPIPACGGGYLRHFPYWFTRWAFDRVARHRAVIVYVHPYEIDTDPPPEWFAQAMGAAPRKTRRFHAIQSRNRAGVAGKLNRLIADHEFAPLGEVIDRALGPARAQ